MKHFTVKDFITYNNPCFSCGSKIELIFCVTNKVKSTNEVSEADPVFYQIPAANITRFNPVIDKKGNCNIKLITTYTSSLILNINLKNNKFITSDDSIFKKYLTTKDLYILSNCRTCGTYMITENLLFNLQNNFIKPFVVPDENLAVHDGDTLYSVFNIDGGCSLSITNKNTQECIFEVELSNQVITLSKLKNRDNLIRKMKTYLTFS